MRKYNAILTAVILLLFLVHAVAGAFQLIGWGPTAFKAAARVALVLCAVHAAVGVKLTADTLRVWKKTGVGYFRENRLFWARRVSGLAVMVLLCFHFAAFGDTSRAVYRLQYFGGAKLAGQMLLVAALAVHVLSNVKPMLISFGIRALRPRAGDILLVLSVLLLVFAAAFAVYYLRWNRL